MIHRLFVALLLLPLLAVPNVAWQGTKPEKPPRPAKADGKAKKGAAEKPAAEVVEGALGKSLDEAVLSIDRSEGGFCGIVAVASKGKTLLLKGYGIADAAAAKPMPPDALFDWASVTKQFTAALTLRVIELSALEDAALKKVASKTLCESLKKWKKLALDDPLSRFFPDAPKDKATVTLRQLLNHTSGIESGFKGEWQFDHSRRDSFVKLVLGLPMTSKPGEKHEYSNSGYAFVAALLEIVSGLPFEELCAEQLFKPAGMAEATSIGQPGLPLERVPKIARGTGFTDRPTDFVFAYGNTLSWGYRGCGGVVAGGADMLAWDRALRDGKWLSKASLAELYKPALSDYALGWEVKKVKGGTRVEHSGGVLGVVTYFLRHLDEDYVVALACSYEPKTHPALTAEKLAQIVERGK